MCGAGVYIMQVEEKVCGSDGVTYVNECVMRMTSCRTQKSIQALSHSHCGLPLSIHNAHLHSRSV